MFCGSFPILYGKPWALVQTFQTQRAFLFCPDRVAVLALYGLFRTLSSAFIATNTLVLHHLEMLCLALVSVGEVIPVSQPMGETQIIEVADLAGHSHFRYLGNALFLPLLLFASISRDSTRQISESRHPPFLQYILHQATILCSSVILASCNAPDQLWFRM